MRRKLIKFLGSAERGGDVSQEDQEDEEEIMWLISGGQFPTVDVTRVIEKVILGAVVLTSHWHLLLTLTSTAGLTQPIFVGSHPTFV